MRAPTESKIEKQNLSFSVLTYFQAKIPPYLCQMNRNDVMQAVDGSPT